MLKACIGLGSRRVDYIDRRNCNLPTVPEDVYRHESTLEELLLDCNAIQDIPPKLFRMTNLKRLTFSENDIMHVPPGIANFTKLVELDASKNAIEEVPNNIQFCTALSVLNLSSNPLMRTPEVISALTNLTQLSLDDVSIPSLPTEIGNASNLVILEARENLFKTIPKSVSGLKSLKRLDVGNNDIEYLPDEIGELEELTELWLDNNCLTELPETITNLSHLSVLDVTKNKLENLPLGFSNLCSLSDLHASENCIQELPDDFGNLTKLVLLKLDFNHLIGLPESIGKLSLVTELLLFDNMLESIPPTLFDMQSLRMLNLDRNHLMEIPSSVGKCKNLHILSVRENELMELPEEIGMLAELTVLDLVGNRLPYLPLGIGALKHLDALWIDGSQTQPLVTLYPESDPENPDKKHFMCQYLPQQDPYLEENDVLSETTSVTRSSSFHRGSKMGVAFHPSVGGGLDTSEPHASKLVRFPTPFRKDLRAKRKKKYKPGAIPSTTIFKKGGSQDDLTLFAVYNGKPTEIDRALESTGDFNELIEEVNSSPLLVTAKRKVSSPPVSFDLIGKTPLVKMSGVDNLDIETNPEEIGGNSQLQTIEVKVDLVKVPNRSLGFSIAGGKGSTPAYEDVDESIFITKVAPGGLAEQDGKLRLGDKLLSVNDVDMTNSTHTDAVTTLKNITDECRLVVSREILVVMPDEYSGISFLDDAIDTPSSPPLENGDVDPQEQQQTVSKKTDKKVDSSSNGGGAAGDQNGGSATEGGAENFARMIVSEILDQSTVGTSQLKSPDSDASTSASSSSKGRGGVSKATTTGGGGSESESTVTSPSVNYVNYDIAQAVGSRLRQSRSASGSASSPGATPQPDQKSDTPATNMEDNRSSRTDDSFSLGYQDDDEFPQVRVVLDRQIGKLGLSIVGGSDHVSRVFGQGRPGIYISKISPGGAAAATGKLKLGDKITKVNGQDLHYASHKQAVHWLVSQKGDINLIVQHVPPPNGMAEVTIVKEESEKLGICIKGGGKGSKGNPLDKEDDGIFISKITASCAAEKDGRLTVGQRLIEVNGVTMLGASHSDAVNALRSVPNNVKLLVCDGYDPREVLRKKKIAEIERASLDAAVKNLSLLSQSNEDIWEYCGSLRRRGTTGSKKGKNYSSLTLPAKHTSSYMSRSFGDINSNVPVTTEDLDLILKNFPKLREMDEEGGQSPKPPLAPKSTPVPPHTPPPISTITFSLQNGDFELFGEKLGDMELPGSLADTEDENRNRKGERANLNNQNPATTDSDAVGRGGGGGGDNLEDELMGVGVEDTGDVLAQLDQEMSSMQTDVSRTEEALVESARKAEEIETRKKQRLTAIRQQHEQSHATHEGSPISDRKLVDVKIDFPAEEPIGEEAMKSIMDVFDDLSTEDFEVPSVASEEPLSGDLTPLSGALTPTTELYRRMGGTEKPENYSTDMNELVRALKHMGEISPKPTRKTMEAAAPAVSAKPPPSGPTLRVPKPSQNAAKRMSAPPKMEEEEEKDSEGNKPETLSFKEKLALHKKAAESPSSERKAFNRTRPLSANLSGDAPPVLVTNSNNSNSNDEQLPFAR